MNALGGETVTLNVFPDEGFLLAYLNVVDSDNQKVNVVYENGGASFIMPPKSVSVTPIFTNTFIADGEGGFYINMPKDGLDTAYIPIYMPSFNVYDHSGKDGYYTFSSDGSLLLSAPEDYVLQVDGNVKLMRTTKVEDYLDIHDGNSTDAPYKRFRNTTAQGYVLNVRDTSSTNEMLLHFVTDGSGFVADVGGVYLTVSLIKSLAHADVSVAEIPAQTYTGSAICPAVSVTDGQMRLVENVDYTIECLNNVSAGMNAQVKIAGIGNYCGKIFAPFEIAPKEISIAWSEQTSFVYDGYEHAPSAVAEGLLNDDECSIVVSGATDVGDHVAVAKALSNGNYRLPAENLEKPFKITYTDLAALRADYVVSDGEVLVGELLGQWYPFKVSIADGATVTFDGMSIKGFDASDYNWAGLTCEGDCNIILADNSVNTVEGFYSDYPGIYVPVGKTLTISGSGSLETRGGRRGAGIGGGNGIDCGNIVISGGTVTARGGMYAAGIGGGYGGSVGYITITDGVTKVTATRGTYVLYSIGEGHYGTRNGAITIAGKKYDAGFEQETYVYPVSDFAAVKITENQNGGYRAIVNADYTGTQTLNIPDAVVVDEVDFKRSLTPLTPATTVLPFTLPEGTTLNARFYYVKAVEQVGCSWNATMKYIGTGKLPEANTPYAVILNEGESKLKFDMHGKQATVQTGDIADKVDETGKWYFKGLYSYRVWRDTDEGDDNEIGLAYGFAGSNEKGIAKGEFGRIVDGAYAVPMRSYLRKKDASVRLNCAAAARAWGAGANNAGLANANANVITVNFVEDDENGEERTTAVGHLNSVTGEFKIDRWYDLKGRRINNVNRAAKGAYYGKKVLKK